MRRPSPLALTALLTAGLVPMASMAQSSVTVYGRLALSANQVDTGGTSIYELRDNASRLGFRGVEELGGGLRALFGLEMGISADTGLPTNPAYRNSYVGLRGSWGAIALGRLDSANPTGSPLYSPIIALTHFAPNDAGATATSAAMQNARNRTSNSVGYMSPTWGGVNLRARAYLRGAGTTAEPENAARSVDLGLNYQNGPWKATLGFAVDQRGGGLANNEFKDKWQAGVNYVLRSGWDVYLLGGVDRYQNTATTRGDVQYGILGTSYSVGPHKLVLNLMQRDVQTSRSGERDRQQLSYQYFLSRRTDLQAYIDNDGIDSSRRNVRVRAIGAGIRHNF